MSERSNVLAWKAGIPKGIAGSNPVLSAKMNPTEPVKRLKLGFIFLCSEYEFKSQEHSKRDLNPRYYFLYDLRLGIDLMLNFFIYS